MTDDVVAEFIARIERIAVRVDAAGTGIRPNLVSRDRDLLEGAATIAETIPNQRIVDPVAFRAAIREQP